jgi:hypothetical protein
MSLSVLLVMESRYVLAVLKSIRFLLRGAFAGLSMLGSLAIQLLRHYPSYSLIHRQCR